MEIYLNFDSDVEEFLRLYRIGRGVRDWAAGYKLQEIVVKLLGARNYGKGEDWQSYKYISNHGGEFSFALESVRWTVEKYIEEYNKRLRDGKRFGRSDFVSSRTIKYYFGIIDKALRNVLCYETARRYSSEIVHEARRMLRTLGKEDGMYSLHDEDDFLVEEQWAMAYCCLNVKHQREVSELMNSFDWKKQPRKLDAQKFITAFEQENTNEAG